ncbi:MAG: TrmH family RNA methyltransferase [Caldilineaceae bacterium]|nr:TrmH family RNA methyltransferase [Caldilineaceae bacterium]
MITYQIRECSDPACQMRFPMSSDARPGERCPRCGAPTQVVAELNAPSQVTPSAAPPSRLPFEALLDNVRSLFNVGSIFRSADGAGLRYLHLCGITPTPANPKLAKTALGAEQSVGWHHSLNAVATVAGLRQQGYAIWALEEDPAATSLFTVDLPSQPLLLVVGSEVTGVDPAILQSCDKMVAIPMHGVKRSLNVAIAFGVAAVLLSHRWHTAQSIHSTEGTL